MEILKEKRPDVASQVKEINDIIKEQAQEWLENEEKKRDEGIWQWYEGDQRYYWTGKNPPGPENPDPNESNQLTDAEWDDIINSGSEKQMKA